MKKLMFLGLLFIPLFTSSLAFARDSSWLLCQSETILFDDFEPVVVSAYEHRTETGRETKLTFMFGGYTLTGGFDSSDSDEGPMNLTDGTSSVEGTAKLDLTAEKLMLRGTFKVTGAETPVDTEMQCKTLRN